MRKQHEKYKYYQYSYENPNGLELQLAVKAKTAHEAIELCKKFIVIRNSDNGFPKEIKAMEIGFREFGQFKTSTYFNPNVRY